MRRSPPIIILTNPEVMIMCFHQSNAVLGEASFTVLVVGTQLLNCAVCSGIGLILTIGGAKMKPRRSG